MRYSEYRAMITPAFGHVRERARLEAPKLNYIIFRLTLAAVLLTGMCPLALSDAGVFTGNGQNLHQISSKTIKLVSIDVTIVLGRGPFLFNGSVPGMDRAEYQCTFVLRNLSDKNEDVEVGFPVDSEFAKGIKSVSPAESRNWVLEYSFIARDEKDAYHVDFVRRTPQSGPGEFSSVFVWNMRFAPTETKTLTVQYRIPMSMGLVPLQKDETRPPAPDAFGQEFLDLGQLDMAGYITSTGSSWAGDVEKAKFTLITEPFERYFEHRGITEEDDAELGAEEREQLNSSFPVRHPWWFRQIEPAGWKPVKGGVQWEYNDFKPKDPIEVRYYTTPFPRLPNEVNPFVERFLKGLGPKESAKTQLVRLRDVVLAVYGCEPRDQAAKTFASAQIWYHPDQNCSLAQLSPVQRAVLERLEKRSSAADQH